jgi:hypothetical protein
LTLSSLFAALWRRQFDSGPTRLGETNGDRLLWRAGAVFAFPNMFHFFAHELARLRRRRFAFKLVSACPFDCFFFWHITNCFASTDGFGRRRLRRTSTPLFATACHVDFCAHKAGFGHKLTK